MLSCLVLQLWAKVLLVPLFAIVVYWILKQFLLTNCFFIIGNRIYMYNEILDRDWFSVRLFAGARSCGCPITGIQFEVFVIGHL